VDGVVALEQPATRTARSIIGVALRAIMRDTVEQPGQRREASAARTRGGSETPPVVPAAHRPLTNGAEV